MFQKTKLTKDQIQERLRNKREIILANPDYYGPGPASKTNEYKRYKRFLES